MAHLAETPARVIWMEYLVAALEAIADQQVHVSAGERGGGRSVSRTLRGSGVGRQHAPGGRRVSRKRRKKEEGRSVGPAWEQWRGPGRRSWWHDVGQRTQSRRRQGVLRPTGSVVAPGRAIGVRACVVCARPASVKGNFLLLSFGPRFLLGCVPSVGQRRRALPRPE